jgi:thiamine biosynthesis lipoprotein
MAFDVDHTFWAMGSDVRLLIETGLAPTAPPPAQAATREQAFVEDFAHRLSRFAPDSELCAFNADPRAIVPASALLRAAVTAGVWAAERSDGLVDPTLAGAMEAVGYTESMQHRVPASLRDALAVAPPRRPAAPAPAAAWRAIEVDDTAGVIHRPPGIRFDTGGIGKGLCADAVAYRLAGYSRYLVDCGGDIAVGGVGAQLRPFQVSVEHPMTGASIGAVSLSGGGVATSGLNVRIWRGPDGTYRHHLLDPSTATPAWTGLIGATAVSPAGALEAETLSKLALLLGPEGARDVLAPYGGVIVHDTGVVETIGRIDLHSLAGAASAGVAA